jgi:hypothetical protein
MIRAAWMEKIMTKTTDNTEVRELTEELDRIAGGWPGSNWAWATTTISTTGVSGDATGQGHPNWIEIGTA